MKSPLESRALGASLSGLLAPCGGALRPAEPPPTDRVRIGVTLSGGGFRATFAGLGVVRYLADAGLLGDLRFVSSVSGGSVANGMIATRFPQLRDRGFTGAAFDELVIDPLAERVSSRSLKSKLIRNIWRTIGKRNRTDVLAWAFDDVVVRRRRARAVGSRMPVDLQRRQPHDRGAVRVRTRCGR